MKKVSTALSCASIALMLMASGCGKGGSSHKKLQDSYDSLLIQNQQTKDDLNEALNLINEVEEDIARVAEEQQKFETANAQGDLNATAREKIKSNIEYLNQRLEENKAKLQEQEKQLKQKDINVAALSRKIQNLQAEITKREQAIIQLSTQLEQMSTRVARQDSVIADMSETQRANASTISWQEDKLAQAEDELNRAFYCFGTEAELKEQMILKGGGLLSSMKVLPDGFNKEYFMSIDTRKVTSIALFAKKAMLRTNHPANSYRLEKDDEGNITLKITDIKEFWSKGRYLVVQVEP